MIAMIEQQLDYVTMKEVAARLNRKYCCVVGWYQRGIGTPAGRVYLETEKIGGSILTTWQWVEDFLRACGKRDRRPTAETPAAAAARGRRGQRRAEKELNCRK